MKHPIFISFDNETKEIKIKIDDEILVIPMTYQSVAPKGVYQYVIGTSESQEAIKIIQKLVANL